MPKNCSDVTLKCCWRVSYNPERVFSTLQVIEMGLFTGLDCSCFRQTYCSSLLEHPSNFPVEKSKERKANLQGNSRLQVRAAHVPKLLLPEVFSWLDLVGLEGFQSEGSHGALWDELGCCREQERKNQELCWVLGFGVTAQIFPSSSCLVCILQRLQIKLLCVFMELQHSSFVSS